MDTISAQNIPENGISLKDMADRFRNYLAKQEGLYFDIRTIRSFLAGLSVSRLIILEGLSGTGKSSIARYFSTFIGEDSFFAPVQASWRDRTSLLGYYNDFSKRYNETPFIQRLYKMTYQSNHVNIMVWMKSILHVSNIILLIFFLFWNIQRISGFCILCNCLMGLKHLSIW